MNRDVPDIAEACTSFVGLLRARAEHQPDQLAYVYLRDGRVESESITYAELDRRARAIGAQLQSLDATGKRAMLLYPTGLDVITALFGCLYAGVIAIPTPPPEASRLRWTMPRLQSIVKDAEATLVLCTGSILEMLENAGDDVAEIQSIQKLDTERTELDWAQQWVPQDIGSDTLAYLQYTSGSTSSPKGVMIDHGNLLQQCGNLKQACGYTAASVTVTWMPYFHDYGLVEGLLEPLYNGTACYLMSPYAFVKQPFHWLQAISRYRATHSQAPNFAYALCVRRIKPDQLATLDLSSWTSAGNAAEPINPEVMEDFTRTFKSRGFKWRSFSPAYGLAEATLLVSSTPVDQEPVLHKLEKSALEKGTVLVAEPDSAIRTVAGCGRLICDTRVAIVDPETLRCRAADEVGEIWVSDPSVARGYWRRPEETEQTFQAYTADTSEGPFLRTGDLGFIDQGELFVCGRSKDVIVIRGSNHSPQDIEWTVQECHPALRPENTAAFSIDAGGEERLVVAQEIIGRCRRDLDADTVIGAIRESVARQHELDVYAVVLLNPGAVPKTSSGKIQRQACRQMFLDDELNAVASWAQNLEPDLPESTTAKVSPGPASAEVSSIQIWLQAKVAELLKVTPELIDIDQPFARYGLDSIRAVTLAGELEAWLDISIPATVAYDYPSIQSLARHLGATETEAPGPHSSFTTHSPDEPIAIIGLGCRFPGAANPDVFWNQLRDGHDSITEVPEERWDPSAHYDPEQAKPGKMNTRWGGFLDQVDEFDAGFFGISPREARYMDPQQRLLLEVSWEALEHAGISPASLGGSRTGVFIGICSYDYARLQSRCSAGEEGYAPTGTSLSIAANRLSYVLDLRGPSVAIDTACSSSLVAVHQACQSLRSGESDLVLAGGVNVILDPALTIAFSQARMMASDGHCKAFSADADGYVRSEGCGIVTLKRLTDATRDGDAIFAVIRGSAVNQDGRSNGLTAPNGSAQQDVIRSALANAAVEPSQIDYIEAHGTGTSLGDPIEFNSLMAVLSPGHSSKQRCWVGSVKTNIGHLEAAAGIAGLIKTTLSLHQNEIPPNLHFSELNPHISIDGGRFAIPTVMQPWKRKAQPRFAGVSSFGFGGTSAHVVLQEAPLAKPSSNSFERPSHVLTLSAKSEAALAELAGAYKSRLESQPAPSLADICFTANSGRTHFKHRAAIVGDSVADFAEQLGYIESNSDQQVLRGQVSSRRDQKVAFLFSAGESGFHQLGQALFKTQPRFQTSVVRCQEILRRLLDDPLFSMPYGAPRDAEFLNQPRNLDLSLFTLEYGLADLWRSWGIEPAIVAGLGVGRYVAACVAGVLDLEDALKLVVEQAQLKSVTEGPDRLASFERSVNETTFSATTIPLLAMSDEAEPAEVSTPEYWVETLKLTQTPGDFIEPLRRESCDFYLEIGPERSITQHLEPEFPGKCLPGPLREHSDWEQLLASLARLYVGGMTIDWFGFDRGYIRHRASLPTYPFQRKRYWITAAGTAAAECSVPPPAAAANNTDTTQSEVHYNWEISNCLDEVEHLTEEDVKLRLRQLDSKNKYPDQTTALAEIQSRLGGMSASRQALFIRLLDLELQQRSNKSNNESRGSMIEESHITDAELDQLSESEAEALLLKKLESLKY